MKTGQRREGWTIDEPAEAAYRELVTQCRVALTVLPAGCAFSHLTAARLLRLPTSYAMDEDTRIHVIRAITSNRVRLPGFCGHRALHRREVVDVEGLPVVGAADTWVDLGELVGRGKCVGLDDLIVVGDACATLLGAREPMVLACLRRVRPRGKRTLLEAYEEIRVGSASAGETVARLMLVRAGLPEPLLNEPIFATWDPDLLLGVGDLVWIITLEDGRVIRLVGEYQGEAFHSSDVQRARDERRGHRLGDDGWAMEEIWKGDVGADAARRETVERFASALEFPPDRLRLSEVGWRFFSTHAMELAIQRQMRRSAS
ncbi:MAG TPA: hypothetical protein VFL38_09710 [Humibacillus xanthopallidus]|nr:hypothetical protein [Humibacillus xanthopallidus]